MMSKFLNRLKFGDKIVYIVLIFVFTALAAALSFPLISTYLGDVGHDSHWYILLSEGRIGEVLQPFSGRIFYPFLAGWIDKASPLDIGQSFFLLGAASLFFFLIINSFVLKKTIKSPYLFAPLFFLPYFLEVTREFFVPDIFYVFLTALFFLFLSGYRPRRATLMNFVSLLLSGLMLFLLFLTREATLLLGVVILVVSLMRRKRWLFVATLAVILLSVFMVGQFNDLGLPNVHNLGSFSYLALKTPYNFLNNFLGIKLWINTLPHLCEPVFRLNLPPLPSLGSVNQVGFCGFGISSPLNSFVALLTLLGVMPVVVLYILFKKLKTIISKIPFWLLIALVSGSGYYFASVFVTTGVSRVVGFGWPAFLLAAPFLIQAFFHIDKKFVFKLVSVHILVVWLPFVFQKSGFYTTGLMIITVFVAVMAYVYVFRVLNKQERRSFLET